MSANNAQKTPFARSLNDWATARWGAALDLEGKSLPASVVSVDNSIVTVKFELQTTYTLPEVTVPVATSNWRREPIQVGDLGGVRSYDAMLGAISGLGAATTPLVTTASLECLVWEPLSSSKWDATPDPDAYVIQGPNGWICRDVGDNCSIVGNSSDVTIKAKTTLKLQVGSSSITVTSSSVTINGVVFDTSGNVSGIVGLTTTGNASLGGGSQPVKLADNTAATKVRAT